MVKLRSVRFGPKLIAINLDLLVWMILCATAPTDAKGEHGVLHTG
jgi:hypothetical protein